MKYAAAIAGWFVGGFVVDKVCIAAFNAPRGADSANWTDDQWASAGVWTGVGFAGAHRGRGARVSGGEVMSGARTNRPVLGLSGLRTLALVLLASCALTEEPSHTDAGADPSINACCWRLAPSAIRACFHERAAEVSPPGECRYLRCLGGLETFHVCS